ncbi:hypothetical protein ACEN9F_21495 [Duganella sp. CT11-25]|jgi:hypothetical protein|uniref:hypothetical protein n=1 Tax=unclassified Duganella TaxID=2636909 RepID=UPI0039AFF220
MKFSYASAGAAMALAAALAGCGGKAQFTVQGLVSGLNNSGLVLANGGNTVTVPVGATTFAFAQQIDYGTEYNITVQTNPAHMTCSVVNGSGSAGHTVTIQAGVTCSQNTYTLGGQFTGLTADSAGVARAVTLLNGTAGGAVTISSANATTAATGTGDFTLGTVADGQAYGVTVQSQPTGLTCTIANGTGVMHEAAVSNLVLTCVPTPATP